MRVLFAGTPEIAVPSLHSCVKTAQVVGVLTMPDRPSGRRRKLTPSPVKTEALKLDLPVFQPEKLNTQAREDIAARKPELLVVFAYGKFFGPRFMALFPKGGVNIHPSLLPQLRGPSPIQSAILEDLDKTGLTVQTISQEMDTGDILHQQPVQLTKRETARSLENTMALIGAEEITSVLASFDEYYENRQTQNHNNATQCRLIEKDDGTIDWTRSVEEIDSKIRAFNPWPKAETSYKGTPLYILNSERVTPDEQGQFDYETQAAGTVIGMDKRKGILIQTGNGLLAATVLQLKAKKPLDYKSFYNGVQDIIGCRLGEDQ